MRVRYIIKINEIPDYLTKINNKLRKIKTIEFKYFKNYYNKERFNPFLKNYIIPLKYNNKELVFKRNKIKDEKFQPSFILYDDKNQIINEIKFSEDSLETELFDKIISNDIN